jgi:hypothetical protein
LLGLKTASTGIPVVRIFVSSPSDAAERRIAREVINQLNAEFAGRSDLETYFWEYEPFDFSKSFRSDSESADFDVVLCFLVTTRSRLHSASKLPDGSPARSGTGTKLLGIERQKEPSGPAGTPCVDQPNDSAVSSGSPRFATSASPSGAPSLVY